MTRLSARIALAGALAAALIVTGVVTTIPQPVLAQTACAALVDHALPNARVLTATAVAPA